MADVAVPENESSVGFDHFERMIAAARDCHNVDERAGR